MKPISILEDSQLFLTTIIRQPNCRSDFSKSYSLAGLRVGYALASSKIIQVLDRVRDAYNVDRIAQSIAQVALEDRSHFEANCEKIIQTRSQSEAF